MFQFLISDSNLWVLFTSLGLCGIVILYYGMKLSLTTETFAEKKKISSSWLGLTVLAMITSMPELTVVLTSSIMGKPELGVGDIFGACQMNLIIIVLLDALQGSGAFSYQLRLTHILPASMSILIIGLAILGIVVTSITGTSFIGFIVLPLMLLAYIYGNRLIYKVEQLSEEGFDKEEDIGAIIETDTELLMKIILYGILISSAGALASLLANDLSVYPFMISGKTFILGGSFVGVLFLGFITALPEFAVSFSAMKLGAVDMAVSNILGSIAFNVTLLIVMQLTTTKGIFLLLLQAQNGISILIPAVGVIIMIAIVMMGLIYRSQKSFLQMGLDSFAVLLIYILTMWLFFEYSVHIAH